MDWLVQDQCSPIQQDTELQCWLSSRDLGSVSGTVTFWWVPPTACGGHDQLSVFPENREPWKWGATNPLIGVITLAESVRDSWKVKDTNLYYLEGLTAKHEQSIHWKKAYRSATLCFSGCVDPLLLLRFHLNSLHTGLLLKSWHLPFADSYILMMQWH